MSLTDIKTRWSDKNWLGGSLLEKIYEYDGGNQVKIYSVKDHLKKTNYDDIIGLFYFKHL